MPEYVSIVAKEDYEIRFRTDKWENYREIEEHIRAIIDRRKEDNMPETKLKPCPFCGSQKLKVSGKSKDNRCNQTVHYTLSVRCNNCHARGSVVSGDIPYHKNTSFSDMQIKHRALEQEAIEAWNRRSDNEHTHTLIP